MDIRIISSPTLMGGKCEAFFICEISEVAKVLLEPDGLDANPQN